jgi:hypothetical protein
VLVQQKEEEEKKECLLQNSIDISLSCFCQTDCD